MAEDPDVAFVLEAFHAFEVQEGTLEEYHARFWVPDGVIEFVDGFPISGRYEGLDGYRRGFAGSYAPYEDGQPRPRSNSQGGGGVAGRPTRTGGPEGEGGA